MQVPAGPTARRAWRSTASTAPPGRRCPAGRTSTRPSASCTAPRPPRPCSWRPPRQPVPGTSGRPTPPTRHGCWPRPGRPTTPRGGTPSCSPRTTTRGTAAGRTTTATWTTTATGRAAELWLATGDASYEDRPRLSAHAADPFDPVGFDFDRVAAPARLDLALHGGALPDHDRVVDDPARRRRPAARPAVPPAVGAAVRARRRVGLGLQRPDPQQPRRARRRPPGHREHRLPRRASPPGWTTCWAATPSARATSPGTAPTTATTSAPGSSATTSTRRCRHPRPAPWPAARTPIPAPDFPYDDRLVGLPPQQCYLDEPTSEVTNDVCIRWNAPLVWVSTLLSAQIP